MQRESGYGKQLYGSHPMLLKKSSQSDNYDILFLRTTDGIGVEYTSEADSRLMKFRVTSNLFVFILRRRARAEVLLRRQKPGNRDQELPQLHQQVDAPPFLELRLPPVQMGLQIQRRFA